MAQNTAALVTGRLGFASISLVMSRSSLSAREVMYFSESVVAKAYCAPAMFTRTLFTIAASLSGPRPPACLYKPGTQEFLLPLLPEFPSQRGRRGAGRPKLV